MSDVSLSGGGQSSNGSAPRGSYAVSILVIGSALFQSVALGAREWSPPIGLLLLVGAAFVMMLALVGPRGARLNPRKLRGPVVAASIAAALLVWDQLRGVEAWSPAAYWVPFFTILVLITFAGTLFDDQTFERAFWDVARAYAAVGILAWLISLVLDFPILVNDWNDGYFRAQSIGSEPAALAPVVAAGLLLSVRRRSWVWASVFALLGAITFSPSVAVVTGASVLLVILFQRSWKAGVAGSALSLCLLAWLSDEATDTALRLVNWAESSPSNPLSIMVNRLAGAYLQLGGHEVGWADSGRQASARAVAELLRSQEAQASGIGFGNDGTLAYLLGLQPNNLVYHFALAWGFVVALTLMALLVVGVLRRWTCRTFPIFVAFLIGSLVSSTGGWQYYGVVLLGAVVPTCRIRARPVGDTGGVSASVVASTSEHQGP